MQYYATSCCGIEQVNKQLGRKTYVVLKHFLLRVVWCSFRCSVILLIDNYLKQTT